VKSSLHPGPAGATVRSSAQAAALEPGMTDSSRFLLRLRRRALQCYDLLLYVMLLALAIVAAMPASSGEAQDDAVHCGKNQSSTVVITK
jgi:hypothetical protein